MGLRYAFLVSSRTGTVDLTRPAGPAEAEAVMRRLFPRTPYVRTAEQRLLECCLPDRENPAVGVFEGGVVVATADAHLYDPDILHRRYHSHLHGADLQLITSRSYDDMFAYGRWRDSTLQRVISVNAEAGVWRDEGAVQAFEPFPVVTPDRWLEFANAALDSALRLQGDAAPELPGSVDWDDDVLHPFVRSDR